MTDLIDTLAGIAPGSALDKARDNRLEARKHVRARHMRRHGREERTGVPVELVGCDITFRASVRVRVRLRGFLGPGRALAVVHAPPEDAEAEDRTERGERGQRLVDGVGHP